MKLDDRRRRQWVLAAGLGTALMAPALAGAGDFRFAAREATCGQRVWVPPVFETRVRTVTVEPVYEMRTRRVWVPPVFEDRWVTREVPAKYRMRDEPIFDRRGRVIGSRTVREVIQPARTIREKVRVEVRPGCHKEVRDRVLVRPGDRKVVRERVLVREGYYTVRHGPNCACKKGFSFGFGFRW